MRFWLAAMVLWMSGCPWYEQGWDKDSPCREVYFDLGALGSPDKAICPHLSHRIEIVPPLVGDDYVVICRCPQVK